MNSSHLQKLSLKFDKECIPKFRSFLEEILVYKNLNVKGVIMNFNMSQIEVIYYYEDEKDDELNYFESSSDENPYHNFTYLLIEKNQNFDFKTFDKINYLDNDIGGLRVISIRVEISKFIQFTNYISNQSKIYSYFFFKAKTMKDNTTGLRINSFYCQFDQDGARAWSNFEIIIPKKKYLIVDPFQVLEKDLLVTLYFKNSYIEMRETADQWSKRVKNYNYKPENRFIIIKASEFYRQNEGPTLELKCYFNTKVFTSVTFSQGYNIVAPEHLDKMVYKIRLDTFIRIFKIKFSYKDTASMMFYPNSILLYCNISHLKIKENIFSITSIYINAEQIDAQEVNNILFENDINIMD